MQLCDVISIALAVVAVILIYASNKPAGSMKADTGDRTIDYYIKIKNKYMHGSIIFLGAFYWLTLFSLLSTIIVIYLSSLAHGDNTGRIFCYSVISLLCTIINFVMNLRDISMAYRESAIILEKAVLKARDIHDHDPENRWKYQELYEADHQTEEILKGVIK